MAQLELCSAQKRVLELPHSALQLQDHRAGLFGPIWRQDLALKQLMQILDMCAALFG
jgi:hypothetical protein